MPRSSEAPFISIVVPVFNEAENIRPLAEELQKILEKFKRYEIIFVDDGSADGSLETLRDLARRDERLRYLSFSRNFGHQAALRAGLEEASGECVVTMDGDFQHPPELIPSMVEAYEEGFDIVSTRRLDGGKSGGARVSLLKRATSSLFYSLINALGDVRIEPGAADFRLISRKACDTVLAMREQNLFLRGAFPWTGLPSREIAYSPKPRRSGKTKYSFAKMLSLALDGITSFSVKPLRLTSFAGLAFSIAGFIYAIYALAIRLFTDKSVGGWASILISVLIIGGLQLLSLGIIGEYLGKLFIEAKRRPPFIVKESSAPAKPARPPRRENGEER
jgi:polyisoprenyl-phosphate glycosyltransferase